MNDDVSVKLLDVETRSRTRKVTICQYHCCSSLKRWHVLELGLREEMIWKTLR